MNLSIRFPNISAYFEGMNKSFTVFGFEITVYGILVAVGMLLGLVVIMLQVRKHKENPNLYLGMVLVSLIGGVIGLILSYVVVFRMRDWLLDIPSGSTIPVNTLISIPVLLAVFAVCLVINLLSAGIPAYRASRMKIINSLNQNDN